MRKFKEVNFLNLGSALIIPKASEVMDQALKSQNCGKKW